MKKRNNRLSSGTGATLAALACLFLLLLLCAACTQESGVPGAAGGNPPAGGEDDPQAGTELVVGSVSIGTAAPDAAGQTRAVTPVALTSGSIGIGVRAENGYAAQQVKYTYNSTTGKWEPDGMLGIQLKSTAASLYAWYPYEATSGTEDPIPLQLQTYSDAKNLHFCNSGGDNVCATYPGATFELKPIYTRLQVNITGADPKVATNPAINIYPTNHGNSNFYFSTEGTLSLTGDIDIKKVRTEIYFVEDYHALWDAQTLKTDVLMIPNESTPIERMVITLDSNILIWELSFSDAPIALEAGKTYTVNVQLDKGTISIKETINKEDYETQPIQQVSIIN